MTLEQQEPLSNAQVVNTQFGQLLVASVGDETRSITLDRLATRLEELAEGQRRRPEDEAILHLAAELVWSLKEKS